MNFKTTKLLDGSITLSFDSSNASQCCEFVILNKIKIIMIMPDLYLAPNLNPILPLIDFIEGLVIVKNVNYEKLAYFKNLIFLSIDDNKKDIIDLEQFPKLEILNCIYSIRLKGLQNCHNLKELTITNFISNELNLSSLAKLSSLKSLFILKSKINSLFGIDKLMSLERLELYGLSNLTSLEYLKPLKNNLTEIEISKCKFISDFNKLGELSELNKLIISESGSIENLLFLKNLKNLTFLNFWGTSVIDGNLLPCKGINFVGFDNKRHYNMKSEDFKKALT